MSDDEIIYDDDIIDLTTWPDIANTDDGEPLHGDPLDTPPEYNSNDDEDNIIDAIENIIEAIGNGPPGPEPASEQSERSGPSTTDFWMALHRLLNITFEKVGF